MSTCKANNFQIGQSVTATNNFVLYQPASPDGTVRLGNGNSGSVTDLITVGTTGNLTFANSVSLTAASTKTLTLNGGGLTNGLVLDASNNVGIGGSPGVKLDTIIGWSAIASNDIAAFQRTGGAVRGVIGYDASASSGDAIYFGTSTNQPIQLRTNNTIRAVLDTSGNLGLGVTPSAGWSGKKALQVGVGACIYGDTSYGGQAVLGANIYSGTSGNIYYLTTAAASYYSQYAGVHYWFNAPSGTAGAIMSPTQAMTLDASGRLIVGNTSQLYGFSGRLYTEASSSAYLPLVALSSYSGDLSNPAGSFYKYDNNSTTSQVFVRFAINNGGAGCGQINGNGASAAAFGSFSDSRLKENITALPNQLANICNLKPCEFDYKDGSGHQIGFIAQEMQEVYPDVVGEGEDEMLTITGWSKTEARLVKAIQELSAELNELKQKVNA